MAAHDIGALPILDEHRLMGIVTERDILARVVASGLDPATTPVADIMSTDLVVADVSEGCAVLPATNAAGAHPPFDPARSDAREIDSQGLCRFAICWRRTWPRRPTKFVC